MRRARRRGPWQPEADATKDDFLMGLQCVYASTTPSMQQYRYILVCTCMPGAPEYE